MGFLHILILYSITYVKICSFYDLWIFWLQFPFEGAVYVLNNYCCAVVETTFSIMLNCLHYQFLKNLELVEVGLNVRQHQLCYFYDIPWELRKLLYWNLCLIKSVLLSLNFAHLSHPLHQFSLLLTPKPVLDFVWSFLIVFASISFSSGNH